MTPAPGLDWWVLEGKVSGMRIMRFFIVLLVFWTAVTVARGQMVYTCEKDVELPNLRLCGMTQDDFCATQSSPQPSETPVAPAAPAPTWCELTPEGTVVLMAGGTPCPAGFVDDSALHANRYLAVGGDGGTLGTASDLDTRTAPVSGLMAKNKDRGLDFNQEPVVMPTAEPVTVRSVDVAPALLLRLCRRSGSCP